MALKMQTMEEKHPELFQPDLNIDRKTCRRTVPLEVLALGMSRTGTSSMQRALMILGYGDVYHGFAMFANISDTAYWAEGFRAKFDQEPGRQAAPPFGREQFDQLLGHCGAVCDYPANVFGPELIDAYPDAKVVLVERDMEAWYRSFDESIVSTLYSPAWTLLSLLGARYVAQINGLALAWARCAFRARSKEELRANAREGYRRHYRSIREAAPPGRLLEYDLRDGWEPLCRFLGKPVPDVPFPHVNDRDAFHEKLSIIMKRGAKVLGKRLLYVAVPGLTVVATYICTSNQPIKESLLSLWN